MDGEYPPDPLLDMVMILTTKPDDSVSISLVILPRATKPNQESRSSTPVTVLNRSLSLREGLMAVENIDLIHTLGCAFRETGDVTYLDNAIGLVEGMIARNPPAKLLGCVRSVLSHFLSIRPCSVESDTKPSNGVGSATRMVNDNPTTTTISSFFGCHGLHEVSGGISHARALQDTGDMGYLDHVLELTEGITASDLPSEVLGALKSLYFPLLILKMIWLVTQLAKLKTKLTDVPDVIDSLDEVFKAVEMMTAGCPLCRPGPMGDSLSVQLKHVTAIDDLRTGIQELKKEPAVTTSDDRDRQHNLSNLEIRFNTIYERLGGPNIPEKVIQVREKAVTGASTECRDMLNNLWIELYGRFKTSDALADPVQSIQTVQAALAATPWGHPDRVEILDIFGNW